MDAIQNLDLITSVDLSYVGDGKKPVYHFIYASQLYGTMFAIYAKFDGINDGKTFEIKSITMRLINYKGIINIGFADNFSIKNGEFNFGVRGTSMNVEKIIPLTTSIKVAKGAYLPLMFNRVLHPLQEFQRFQSKPVGTVGEETPTTQLFDSEFYERDGMDFYKQETKEGMEGYQAPAPLGHKIIGPRCIKSNVSLRF